MQEKLSALFEKSLPALAALPARFFARDGKRLSVAAYIFLTLLCVGFFAPGLQSLPPTDRDESLFAQASKQMIETGDYTDIRINKQPRYKKPIGIYWLQTTAVRLLNPENLNEIWAYRVPSLIGATVAVLMTAALGALFFSPLVGLLAATMLAGCVLLNVEARLATTDSALLGSIMVAIYAMARAYVGQATRWGVPLAFWTAIAVGVLIKGPIILLPVLGILGWIAVCDKNLAWFKTLRPKLGLLYALVLIAPWFVAIMMKTHGAFLQQSAGNDMLAKIWSGQNRGILPPGLHLLILPILFFPASLFTAFAAPDAWKNRRDSAVKFCLGWIIPTWIVFELSLTKLPHYVMPVYPALALLTAKYLADGFPTLTEGKRRVPVPFIVGTWLVIGTLFAILFTFLPLRVHAPFDIPQFLAGIVLIAAQAFALLAFFKRKILSHAALIAGSFVFLTVTLGHGLPSLQNFWLTRDAVKTIASAERCFRSQVVLLGYFEPSLTFTSKTEMLLPKTAIHAAEYLKQETCRVAVIADANKAEFLKYFPDDAPTKPAVFSTISGLDLAHFKFARLNVFTMVPNAQETAAPQEPPKAPEPPANPKRAVP